MAAINPPIITFAGGVMGRLLHNRVDIPKYPHGASLYENWWPLVQGPMTRRPPLEHVDSFENHAVSGFQLPFVFSVEQSYNVLGTDGTFRFYTQDGAIVIPVVTATISGGTFDTSGTDLIDAATITASSTASGAASNLKDGTSAIWQSDGSATAWVSMDLGSAQTVRLIWLTADSVNGAAYLAPTAWTLKGSATGAFAGEEVLLLTVISDAGWIAGERRRFRVTTPGSYRYYRVNMTGNGTTPPSPPPGGGGDPGGGGGDTGGWQDPGGGL